MRSSSSLSSLASKLCRAARPQPLPASSDTYRCFSSKAKAKGKGKEKEKEKEEEAAPAKKTNKKSHWSQLVFYKVSSKLSGVLQPPEEGLTRPDAIERMWEYIKTNNLQSNDEIVCDETLKKAFGQAKVQRTEILKFLDINLTRLKP
ncbi:hypothetical protein GOP47_0017569 [Adiantum capillus-veneris]|uniref:DM2 domain-containing protein n=1 Tax=Adiantum capillus-veneris TaxID=13818 RepID=A0A9D4UFL3_ADICA|nr:hypothetical protein GOP47_0017569 [Adiantum capillus-veneris]